MQITRPASDIQEVQCTVRIYRGTSNKGGLSVLDLKGLQATGIESIQHVEIREKEEVFSVTGKTDS